MKTGQIYAYSVTAAIWLSLLVAILYVVSVWPGVSAINKSTGSFGDYALEDQRRVVHLAYRDLKSLNTPAYILPIVFPPIYASATFLLIGVLVTILLRKHRIRFLYFLLYLLCALYLIFHYRQIALVSFALD